MEKEIDMDLDYCSSVLENIKKYHIMGLKSTSGRLFLFSLKRQDTLTEKQAEVANGIMSKGNNTFTKDCYCSRSPFGGREDY
jgi:hypothetical protein